ncbi:MAG: CRISPR-associated endonuclease Cas3'' [Candidatus Bathyarchaeia archaeon]|nr:CRISPR-associated endonuclease Cas3'' [Candidatus Bathyarchaeota archaeon]
MGIISYYLKKDNNIIIEELHEHIDEAIKIINQINYSPILRYVKRIFPKLKNFNELINLAIIFHDSGKVFFQEDKIENKEYLSFKGHEFLSNYIFEKFYEKANVNSEENYGINFAKDIISFAILFHHHSMNIKERLNEINFKIKNKICLIDRLYDSLKFFLTEKHKIALKHAIEKIKTDFKNENLVTLLKEDQKTALKRIWENIWCSEKNVNEKKLSLIVLTILLVSDNIAAQNKRGQQQTKNVFHLSLEDFYNFYLVKK